MPGFLIKEPETVLRNALQKLTVTTPLTSVGPGSIVRALTEVVVSELGDMYALIDFNTSMTFLSTAQGRALDMIGRLFNVERKALTQIATVEQSMGAFYFYLDSPYSDDIIIPAGTSVTTATQGYVGNQYFYLTTEMARIPIGRTRTYVGIRPSFSDSVFTTGVGTLTLHNFPAPDGVTVRCTNPKVIQAQVGYELDNSYRARIQKSVRTSAGGTEEALRFTALSVPGVRDIQIRTAPYGLGSFEVLVTAENNALSAAVLVAAATAMDSIRPVGVRMFVREPTAITVEISATVIMKDMTGIDRAAIARRVEVGAMRYINTLLTGAPLIYSQLMQYMIDASEFVRDLVITSFKIDGVESLRRNVQVNGDQQLIPGAIRCSY